MTSLGHVKCIKYITRIVHENRVISISPVHRGRPFAV